MGIHTKLRDLLLESGLNEAEAILYIELLKQPAEKAWDLVKRTGLTKSTVYRTISKLESLKIITDNEQGIRALSLKSLVADLKTAERKLKKTICKIQQIAPFLHSQENSIEEFEHLYAPDQIADAYLFMAQQNYQTNLDFGDFEAFVPKVGGMSIAKKFREYRVKHANHTAICTTFGQYTQYFCTKAAEQQFKNNVKLLDFDFKNKFIIFSDNNDYVLFNNVEDEQYPESILVKSKPIADIQRAQFQNYSQMIGKD
jgi:predicted transcriptional regulator